jgi:hypothetical protein
MLSPATLSSSHPDRQGVSSYHFCNAFKQTALYVWNSFYQSPACMNIPDHSVARDQCTVQGIIGFESKDKGMLNESVQAILRNVPYIGGDAKRYTFDKFILFWAPYNSIFNLDPYTRLVHNPIDGIDAPGAYSFSIDDRFGNFSGRGSALIIDVGGSAALQNKEPYDFWEQYRVSYAAGWDHATVCGRPLNIPGKSAGSAGISFWRNGVKTTCDIVFYKTAAETGPQAQFAKYQVGEGPKSVTDTYTGLMQTVTQLTYDPSYCKDNSTPALLNPPAAVCINSHIDATRVDDPRADPGETYVSLSDADKPKVTLIVPAPPL